MMEKTIGGEIGGDLLQLHPVEGKLSHPPVPILARKGLLALHQYPEWLDGIWGVSRLADGVRIYEFGEEEVARTFLERHGDNPIWADLVAGEVDKAICEQIQDWVAACRPESFPVPPVTSPRRRGRQPRPEVAESVLDAVRAVVASAGRVGVAKSEVLREVTLSDGDWNQVINFLIERKQIVRTGAKKGARYFATKE